MQVQAFINDTERFNAYGDINGNNIAVYGEYRPSGWKFFYELDNNRVNYYKFMEIFDEIMTRFIKKYQPPRIKLHTKFRIKPIILCNKNNYKYFVEKNKLIIEKV